jgi:hypothetical protein
MMNNVDGGWQATAEADPMMAALLGMDGKRRRVGTTRRERERERERGIVLWIPSPQSLFRLLLSSLCVYLSLRIHLSCIENVAPVSLLGMDGKRRRVGPREREKGFFPSLLRSLFLHLHLYLSPSLLFY